MKTSVSLLSFGFALFVYMVILCPVVMAQKQIKTAHYNWTLPEISPKPESIDTAGFRKSEIDTIVKGRDTIIRHFLKKETIIVEAHKNKRLGGYSTISKGNFSAASAGSENATTEEFDGYDYLSDTSLTFGIYKWFYPSGKIKVKGGRSRLRFDFGMWYYFNEDGSLQKTIDRDKDFTFTMADVLNYCDKNNIPLGNYNDSRPTYINKWLEKDKRCWAITYHDAAKLHIITVELSADDGSLVKKAQDPYTSSRY
ncbi:MAG: hypothetical protein JWR50_1161 [Mucilaginibacter sp.]|nr:hypothetical protein [Mucilaginibacter sp.]